jgi:hypothetical protein
MPMTSDLRLGAPSSVFDIRRALAPCELFRPELRLRGADLCLRAEITPAHLALDAEEDTGGNV